MVIGTLGLPAALGAILLCAGSVQCLAQEREGPLVLYVATDGNDAWSGTLAHPDAAGTDGPLATLDAARDALRALRAEGRLPEGGATVMVAGGTYELSQTFELGSEDSGTAEAPVVFRAAPGEEVRLQGGRSVDAQAFSPVIEAAVVERLQEAARGQVLEADLGALGIPAPAPYPEKFRGFPAVPEVFFNDRRLAVASWPQEGWAHIARIIDSGSNPRVGDDTGRPGVFEYEGDRPDRWNVEAGVWLQGYWCFDWYAETIKVQSIDKATRQITLAQPHLYSVKQGNPSPRRYRALNLLEELDSPGEYYIDAARNTLYLWPPDEMAGARMVISTLSGPLVAIRDAAYIVLRGFTVEAGQGDGIVVSGGESVRVQACRVRNVRTVGVVVQGGARHRVEACDIHDTGTGGVVLSGGDRKALTPAGHEAVNNHIHHYSCHQLTYANAILIGGVGNRAAHNLIHDAPHQAIGVGGNDHIFEYNVVHHVCTQTDDCGAYYKGRDPSCRGNVVRYNFWHNIGSPMGHGNAAVYFDDGDGGDFVIGNVFFRCGEPGKGSFGTVFSHGGHDLWAENNVFIECKRALGSAPWNDKRWAEALRGEDWQNKLLRQVDITGPPYTTRYPALEGFMDPRPGVARVSHAVRNLLVMCGQVKSGNWQVDEEQNLVTDADPGFLDAAGGDFRLRPQAEVFTKLPGFEPIPFEQMGLYADELRPSPMVEAWTYDPPRPLPPLQETRAAAPAVKKGPAPVFPVPQAAGPITIDGIIDPAEWGGADPAAAMLLAQDYRCQKASRESRAWLAHDEQRLYLAVDNAVHPDTTLTGNRWGLDDAVEVSLRVPKEGKSAPICVVRGYGNGYLQYGTTADPAEEPGSMDVGGIVYRAEVVEKGRWTCEMSIPFSMLGFTPAEGVRSAFNLTVRKALDDLWLMWEGTGGHSYDVDRAGFVEFAR